MTMEDNIKQVLENTVKLENIEDKAEQLQAGANMFKKNAKGLKDKMWWKNCKQKLKIRDLCSV